MRHKDGTYRWMSCRGVVVRDDGGRAVRLMGAHADVTAERVCDTPTGLPNRLLLIDHHPHWKKLLDEDAVRFRKLVPDGIHPAAEGCAQVIMPTLRAALGLTAPAGR